MEPFHAVLAPAGGGLEQSPTSRKQPRISYLGKDRLMGGSCVIFPGSYRRCCSLSDHCPRNPGIRPQRATNMANDIWIVTSFFNPCHYSTKKINFELFASRVRAIGAQLLVIEMAQNEDEFELSENHYVLRVRGDCLMWQKERMLNIAIAKLPSSCTKVAWIDCDILFEYDEWLDRTSQALEHHAVVQPYESCVRLPRGQTRYLGAAQDGEKETESFAAVIERDRMLARNAVYKAHGHTGFAWAARRELLDTCGLYDACLTGSSDHLMAHVFAGTLDSRCIPAMIGTDTKYANHFGRWAVNMHNLCLGSLGHIPGRVLHLWHGSLADRRYFTRNQDFKKFDFDPDRHLRQGDSGLWEWAEASELIRAWSSDLFYSRNEDGHLPPFNPVSHGQH